MVGGGDGVVVVVVVDKKKELEGSIELPGKQRQSTGTHHLATTHLCLLALCVNETVRIDWFNVVDYILPKQVR